MTLNGHYVWITGASSGIGKALAKALHQEGAYLALSGRNPDKLHAVAEEIGASDTLILPFDVTQKADHARVLHTLLKTWPRLDMAILNAGDNAYVDWGHFDSQPFEHLVQTNFLSVVYGIEALLHQWGEKPGHIVAVGSLASYGGLPRASAYGASKAAVRNMIQALQIDSVGSNKQFTLVTPGFVKTPLTDRNTFTMPFLLSPEQAAQYIVKGLKKGKLEIYFPFIFSMMLKIFTSLPARLSRNLIYKGTRA